MSFFDDLPPYIPSPPPYSAAPATDAIVLSHQQQFPVNNEPFNPHSPFNDHDQPPSFKRARTSSDSSNHSNALPCPPRMMMMHPHNNNNNNNPLSNKGGSGTGHIFFKTRMCAKFRLGSCRNGENCNFAHGTEDMRQPPPNWQELVGLSGSNEEQQRRPSGNWDDDQKIIHKMKLCKKYYNGEECPYGERCNFLHEDPAKFRDDSGRIRESSAISIGTNGSPKSYRDGYDYNNSETIKAVAVNMGSNAYRGNVRSTFWKTKLCIKWETTGHCPFGEDCHFAHGQSELHVLGGRIETEAAGAIPISTYATIPTLPKVTSIPAIYAAPAPSNIASPPLANEVEQGKKCLSKWKGPKINRIYADWLDDVPLVQNLPSGVET